jgi:hypothetical protein
MSDQKHHVNSAKHGDYERRDVTIPGILYFLLGLFVAGVFTYFIGRGLFAFLERQATKDQAPLSPLVTNAPVDTRHVAKGYPQSAFPDPKLEEDERGQMIGVRLNEEQTLSTYDYIDQKAGTVRIPIDRAMELIAQRGLPVRKEGAPPAPTAQEQKKGTE